ncbi:MAG: DNA repair protein RadA [Steroidobacteraceae bacterium]|jgi:DNA repair protein RadA/Sms|nr:DNA repair protein RadA [Steroidobacteraceae bacterium]
MAKTRTAFVCSSCGAEAPRWQGQCPACGEWNTLSAFHEKPASRRPQRAGAPPAAAMLEVLEAGEDARLVTGLAEFDRVLGGGLVPGSVSLIGGDPGIGKSTLLLQAAAALAPGVPVLYATGEESARQVGLRAQRLGLAGAPLRLIAETAVEQIVEQAGAMGARVLVIDSIQTMTASNVEAAAGSVSQLRECAAQLVAHAKSTGTAVLLIGHVTKEGVIAGPRLLEHMVDAVLYFESDSGSRYRVIRAVKNRFGAANEIGVFVMDERGLREVRNPSAIFLSRHDQPVAGSVVTVAREGTRQMLIEVQALADASHAANPRRVAVGLEANRIAMLIAVLHRHAGVALHGHDVFVNVVGGVRLGETAADLPVLAAMLSSLEGRALPQELVTFGEVGLAGEIRPVPYGEERLREAAKHGFRRAVVPRANVPRRAVEGMEVAGVGRLEEAVKALG